MSVNSSKTLERFCLELHAYYERTRGAGHTQAMLNGALNNERVPIVIVSHGAQGDTFTRGYGAKEAIGVGAVVNGGLRGRRDPVLVDNYVLMEVLGQVAESAKAKAAAEAEAERLRGILHRIKAEADLA